LQSNQHELDDREPYEPVHDPEEDRTARWRMLVWLLVVSVATLLFLSLRGER
jgi:hypothetical protein